MSTDKAGLLDAVNELDRVIKRAHAQGFGESVQFLLMARTQLLIDIHGITDDEFRAFCDWLEQPPQTRRGAPQQRGRRDGQLRGMRRAWLCPQDAAALRRSLRRAGPISR